MEERVIYLVFVDTRKINNHNGLNGDEKINNKATNIVNALVLDSSSGSLVSINVVDKKGSLVHHI